MRPRTCRVGSRPRVARSSSRGPHTAIFRRRERAGQPLCCIRCTLPLLERKIARVSSGSGAGVSGQRRRPARLRRSRLAHTFLRERSTEHSPLTVTGIPHSFALGNGSPSLSRGFLVLGRRLDPRWPRDPAESVWRRHLRARSKHRRLEKYFSGLARHSSGGTSFCHWTDLKRERDVTCRTSGFRNEKGPPNRTRGRRRCRRRIPRIPWHRPLVPSTECL